MAISTIGQEGLSSSAQYIGFKNRIINGDMRIDQRNAGASVTTTGAYPVDRFFASNNSSSSWSAQRSTTAPAGFVNSLAFTQTTGQAVSAGYITSINHRIEGFNIADLAWGTANAQTVTLSFWVRSSLTGTFGVSFTNGSYNRSYVASYTINSANTWEYKTVTIPGDTTGTWATDNSRGLNIDWDLGVGTTFSNSAGSWAAGDYEGLTGGVKLAATTGATFYITGVQLEKGSTATSFDYRPYGTELALCQRYYETNYPAGNAVGSSTAGYTGLQMNLINPANGITYVPIQCNVQKRANATWTVYTYTGTSGQWHYGLANATETTGAISINNPGDKMAMIYLTTTPASNQNTMYGRWVASAEL